MPKNKSLKMFSLYCRLDRGPIGVEFANKENALRNHQPWLEALDIKRRGFAQFGITQKLEFVHRKKLGRKPLDFESYGSFWMMKNSCKRFFEEWCPRDVEFIAGNLYFEDGTDREDVWLCDVVSIIDALDEANSDIRIVDHGSKLYNLSGSRKLVFFGDSIGERKVFRMRYAEYMVICSELTYARFRKTGLKGTMFIEVGHLENQ